MTSESAKNFLSTRDKKIIIEIFHARDVSLVAQQYGLERNSLLKIIREKITPITGTLFQFTRSGVKLLPHTRSIVEDLEKSVFFEDRATSKGSNKTPSAYRSHITLAMVDHIQPLFAKHRGAYFSGNTDIQTRFINTSKYDEKDRFQNLHEMSLKLEYGEIDILVYLEIKSPRANNSVTTLPRASNIAVNEIYQDKIVCLLNKDAKVSDPMTQEEFQSFNAVTQVPILASPGQDIQWVTTDLLTASELIKADKNQLCMPMKLVSDYYADLFGLKTVSLPDEETSTVSVCMAWSLDTDQHAECKTVRSAIKRMFVDLTSS